MSMQHHHLRRDAALISFMAFLQQARSRMLQSDQHTTASNSGGSLRAQGARQCEPRPSLSSIRDCDAPSTIASTASSPDFGVWHDVRDQHLHDGVAVRRHRLALHKGYEELFLDSIGAFRARRLLIGSS